MLSALSRKPTLATSCSIQSSPLCSVSHVRPYICTKYTRDIGYEIKLWGQQQQLARSIQGTQTETRITADCAQVWVGASSSRRSSAWSPENAAAPYTKKKKHISSSNRRNSSYKTEPAAEWGGGRAGWGVRVLLLLLVWAESSQAPQEQGRRRKPGCDVSETGLNRQGLLQWE